MKIKSKFIQKQGSLIKSIEQIWREIKQEIRCQHIIDDWTDQTVYQLYIKIYPPKNTMGKDWINKFKNNSF
jgi:hypothetical protein